MSSFTIQERLDYEKKCADEFGMTHRREFVIITLETLVMGASRVSIKTTSEYPWWGFNGQGFESLLVLTSEGWSIEEIAYISMIINESTALYWLTKKRMSSKAKPNVLAYPSGCSGFGVYKALNKFASSDYFDYCEKDKRAIYRDAQNAALLGRSRLSKELFKISA